MKILKSFPIILMIGMIFLLLIVSYMFINKDQSDEEALYPKQGILDLTTWENTRIRPSLIGEWEFYWDQLLSYDDLQQDKQDNKQLVYVPNTWDAYESDQDKLPGFGFATYRIKILNHKSREKLSLRIDTMSTSYKLFINNEEIASNGAVGKDGKSSKPQYQPQVVDFFPPAEEFDLIVQVSNFTYARGGIWYEINLGTPEQIDEINRIIVYKDALLIGSLLIMALYFGSFHFVLRKDKSSKYFMLLCTIFIIRTSIYGDSLLIRIFPSISFELLIFLTYATLYWITIVIYLLVDSLYESHFNVRYNILYVIYGIVATLLTVILPIHLDISQKF